MLLHCFEESITNSLLKGIKPSDSKLTFFLSLRAVFDFYGVPLAVWALEAAPALKGVLYLHCQVDVRSLLDSSCLLSFCEEKTPL